MKNTFFIILIFILFQNCTNTKSVTSNCKIVYEDIVVYVNQIDGTIKKDSLTFSNYDTSIGYNIGDLSQYENSNSILGNIHFEEKLKSDSINFIALYYDKHFKANDTLDCRNAKAIGLYYYQQHQFWYDLYVNDNNTFKILNELSGKTNFISLGSFLDIGREIVLKNSKLKSAISLRKKDGIFSTKGEDDLEKRIKNYLDKKLNNQKNV